MSLAEVLELHRQVVTEWGGSAGLRDLGALEGALAQPRQTYGGADLYPSLAEKAAALGFALIRNHPFVDGNKRVGHAVLEVFLVLNGHELHATVDEAEQLVLGVAAGQIDRAEFLGWVRAHLRTIWTRG
ncbi:MAG TPA: type II toxin-antitoxin system death-on-curing family toxin [Gemmatimonadales bacterium]